MSNEFMHRAVAAYSLPLTDEQVLAAAWQPFKGGEFGLHPSTPDELDAAMLLAAEALPTLGCHFQAARLMLQCGTLIEHGAPTPRIAPLIAERTREIFGLARALLERDDRENEREPDLRVLIKESSDEARAYLGAHYAGLAAMTSLCRDKPARVFARSLTGFADDAESIEGKIRSAYYLSRLLDTVDDFVFEVIDIESRRGYRLSAEGMASCYHLFTLLQGVLIGDPERGWLAGKSPDPELLAYARGESYDCPSKTDSNAWHYLEWPAWTAEGLQNHVAWTLWGQTKPRDIMRFDDMPTILLAPKSLSINWDMTFTGALHDAHSIRLDVVAQLDPGEVDARLAAIAAAKR